MKDSNRRKKTTEKHHLILCFKQEIPVVSLKRKSLRINPIFLKSHECRFQAGLSPASN